MLFEQQPVFDAVGNVSSVATTLPGGTGSQAFCYDEQDRLTWARSASGAIPCGGTNTAGSLTAASYTQSFSYDNLGRLTSGPLGTYSYGDSAHLHGATSISGQWTGSYDASGNLTCRAPSSATTCAGTPTGAQLTYDNEGRLAAWQNAPGSPTSSTKDLYDGEGTRVAQQVTSGSTTTTTAYLGNLEEISITGSSISTTTYYYAGALRIALAVNGVVSYLGADTLGSATMALSASGSVQASQLFAPYGSGRYASGTMPGSYGFTGQRADAATGLDYYVSRYYDPLAGQFAQADTALPASGYDPWGLSRYAYVGGNPETKLDPDGHCFPLCTMIVGALICAAVGAGMSIATQAASGHGVNWSQVGKEAAVGAISGAVSGLVGPEAGLLAHTVVGAAAGAVTQVASNALSGKPLGDGVGTAILIGGISGGAGYGAGKLLGGAVRALRGVGETAAEDAGSEVAGAEQTAAKDTAQGVEGTSADDAANAGRGLNKHGGVMSETGTNAAGGRVFTSTGTITQSDFKGIVNGSLMRGDDIHILTGVHGFPDGTMIPDATLYADDVAAFGDYPGVTVHDVASMSHDAISDILQQPGTIIGGFCDSAACLAHFQ